MEAKQYPTKQTMEHQRSQKNNETNDKENTMIQNLWDAASVLRFVRK